MKTRPAPQDTKRTEVFISATSGDLRSLREIAKQALLTMGYFPVEQQDFRPDYRRVREMLVEKIAACDAVVHIVGVRYGAEPHPATLPPGQPRESYTQMEARIARELDKKLYTFLCTEDFPFDQEPDAEVEEKRALQRAYRERIATQEILRTPIRSAADLALKVRELQVELDKLRGVIRRDRLRTHAILAAIALGLAAMGGGVWWLIRHGPRATAETVVEIQAPRDRAAAREVIVASIRKRAAEETAKLDPAADWQQISELEKGRDLQIADIDRSLKEIDRTIAAGEASDIYLTADTILRSKGPAEALAFLNSEALEREASIEVQIARRDREQLSLRKLLHEDLLAASLLEKQLRFDEAEARYRRVVERDPTWIPARNELAWFLIERGGAVEPTRGNSMLAEAADFCRDSLALQPRAESIEDWAMTQINLGNALQEQGTRAEGEAGAKLLAEAVAAYRAALEVYSKAELPQDWAMTQNNLGLSLQEQGTRAEGEAGAKLLAEAVAAYRAALEVYSKAELPQDWAMTQNNLGLSLQEQGTRAEGEAGAKLLAEAVAAYRAALEVYSKAELPQDWAMTQINLGNALHQQGIRAVGKAGAKLLAEAVASYRAALEILTKADLPQDWAKTQNNLGLSLQEQGTRAEGEAGAGLLAEAVASYRAALEIFTKADLPQHWAATQNNLGLALRQQAARVRGEAGAKLLAEAVAATRAALEIFTKADLPQGWGRTQANLGLALAEQAARVRGEAGANLLAEALASYRAALEILTKADLPQDWARAQNNLGTALREQATRVRGEAGAKLLAEAEAAHRAALEIFTKADQPRQWAMAQKRLGGAAHTALTLNLPELANSLARESISALSDALPLDEYRWIYSNLASALLLQDRYDEALAIYNEHWAKPVDDAETFGEAVLKDFDQFEAAGVTHPAMARVREAFASAEPGKASPAETDER